MKISELKKSRNDESDLATLARLLSFDGSLLCSETHVHVYPNNRESFSVEWMDKGWMDSEVRWHNTGTDYEKTARIINEKVAA